MFEFIDTPNPNAKKIMLEHSFEIAIYLDKKLVENSNLHDLFFHPGFENIFSGPGFQTVTKKDNFLLIGLFLNLYEICEDIKNYALNNIMPIKGDITRGIHKYNLNINPSQI